MRNQRTRCSELPCVKASGTTRPCVCFCSRSSPIARRRAQAFLDVARLEQLSRLRRVAAPTRPHSSRPAVPCAPTTAFASALLARAAARRCTFSRRAEQVLHVVADLVRDHVGLREVARRAEARARAPGRTTGRCRPSGRAGSRTAPSPPRPCRSADWTAPLNSTSVGGGVLARHSAAGSAPGRPRCRPATTAGELAELRPPARSPGRARPAAASCTSRLPWSRRRGTAAG